MHNMHKGWGEVLDQAPYHMMCQVTQLGQAQVGGLFLRLTFI